MPSIETLLAEYVAEHRAGGTADPVTFARRAAPDDRRKLATLLDDYLAHAPRVGLADQAAPDPRIDMTVEALMRSIDGASGLWPALLPRLRKRAGLKRRELVERLAVALGVSDREAKVERYYHEMELGLLPARGVSAKVLEALGDLIGATAAELREAGSALGEGLGGGTRAEAFARMTTAEAPVVAELRMSMGAPEPRDEVDELFSSSD